VGTDVKVFSPPISSAISSRSSLSLTRTNTLTARRSPRRRSSSPARRGSRPFRSMNRLVRGTRRLAQNLRSRFFFPSEPRHSSKLQKNEAKPFFFLCMRPFPLVATTRDDSNQSASAAADPSRSSSPPPLFREEENRGEDDQQGRRDDKAEESPLETEKLRAGIQHLLSSAPAPSAQSRQQKRREATPRRRATPRRAPSSATKKTPASASASASASAAANADAGNSSSSRPYKAQLALFLVSKPTLMPTVASSLRSRAENEGMEDQVSRFIGNEKKSELRYSLFGRTKPHDAHASSNLGLFFRKNKTKNRRLVRQQRRQRPLRSALLPFRRSFPQQQRQQQQQRRPRRP